MIRAVGESIQSKMPTSLPDSGESKDFSDRLDDLVYRLTLRFRVVGLGILIGCLLLALFLKFSHRGFDTEMWLMFISGPFLELWRPQGFPGFLVFGVVLLIMIPAHPIKPNAWTAAISVTGLVLWFFCGMALAGAGV